MFNKWSQAANDILFVFLFRLLFQDIGAFINRSSAFSVLHPLAENRTLIFICAPIQVNVRLPVTVAIKG